jgi:hypothetical protein
MQHNAGTPAEEFAEQVIYRPFVVEERLSRRRSMAILGSLGQRRPMRPGYFFLL